jgi:hypothetical protein
MVRRPTSDQENAGTYIKFNSDKQPLQESTNDGQVILKSEAIEDKVSQHQCKICEKVLKDDAAAQAHVQAAHADIYEANKDFIHMLIEPVTESVL